MLHPRQLGGAAGHGGAEDDVVAAGQAAQQHPHAACTKRVEGDAPARARSASRGARAGSPLDPAAGDQRRPAGRPRPGGRLGYPPGLAPRRRPRRRPGGPARPGSRGRGSPGQGGSSPPAGVDAQLPQSSGIDQPSSRMWWLVKIRLWRRPQRGPVSAQQRPASGRTGGAGRLRPQLREPPRPGLRRQIGEIELRQGKSTRPGDHLHHRRPSRARTTPQVGVAVQQAPGGRPQPPARAGRSVRAPAARCRRRRALVGSRAWKSRPACIGVSGQTSPPRGRRSHAVDLVLAEAPPAASREGVGRRRRAGRRARPGPPAPATQRCATSVYLAR